MQTTLLENATYLRSSGQYYAALSALAAFDLEAERDSKIRRQALLEAFLCHVLSHNFDHVKEFASLINKESSAWPEPHTDLFRLLYAYARFHTNIDLKEALNVSNEIYVRHLQDAAASDFQPVHILLLCFSAILLRLGNMFFGTPDHQCLRKLDELRLFLLKHERCHDLGVVHWAEAECLDPREHIQHLQATIDSSGSGDIDLEIHWKVFQLKACYNIEDRQSVQLMSDLWDSSRAEHNLERHLWAKYLDYKYANYGSISDADLKKLDADVNLQGSRNLKQLTGFLQAQKHLESGFADKYMDAILTLLNQSHSCRLPRSSADLVEINQPQGLIESSQSAWLFWHRYMDVLTADMSSQTRRSLAIRCVQDFFDVQIDCTIPELRYTLATVPAECYEEIGDTSQALRWRALGAEIAKDCDDEEIKAEAECNLQIILADDAVIMLDDPHGAQQKSWNAARLVDLERLYEETKKRDQWKYAFRYARVLLDKELDTAIAQSVSPTGGKWLVNSFEALNHLEDADKVAHRPKILFALAHAKFDYGDYTSCTEDLEEVINISRTAQDGGTERMAMFTFARAKLHLYQDNHEQPYWSSGNEKLDQCLTLCTQEQRLDWIACCHTLRAAMWYAKRDTDSNALQQTLFSVARVRILWTKEMRHLFGSLRLDNLLTKYSLSGRNAKSPYSIFEMAVDICITLGDHQQAWSWVEKSKAHAFHDSLEDVQDEVFLQTEELDTDDRLAEKLLADQAIVLVHWMIIGERILLCVAHGSTFYDSWELDCTKSAIEEWYRGLVASKEDLSDPETGHEILSELQELVRPLFDLATRMQDNVFVLCPTQIIFKIPVHAIPVDGKCLLDLVPVTYTHSFGLLRRLNTRAPDSSHPDMEQLEFFGNPTGDTPAGSEVVSKIVALYGGRQHIDDVSKEEFLHGSSRGSWVHFHGHVLSEDHPLNQAMLFHHGEKLTARDAFKMNLLNKQPVVLLIGCGSGIERLGPGDEPLGLLSGFLFAGASSVIATMWPIHDRLSGAQFSEHFYGIDSDETLDFEKVLNLAARMRAAALSIKQNPRTQAPYFWAGFVLYGRWDFKHQADR